MGPFPTPLDTYPAVAGASLWETLAARATPFNVAATLIFAFAIVHTFLAKRFLVLAHRAQDRHDGMESKAGRPPSPSVRAAVLHFLGEIEVVFGLWGLPLVLTITWFHGWGAAQGYIDGTVDFTEAIFVVVIMALASTRPVMAVAEAVLGRVAILAGGGPAAWWLSILALGPILGSFITEPAAMTICALLLRRQFYARGPSPRLAYATLGLLFVNVSIGGTLTHFSAPPVLMVASRWQWDTPYMLVHFGWKAVAAILVSTAAYALALRRDLLALAPAPATRPGGDDPGVRSLPAWVVIVHLGFMAFTVAQAHHPTLFVAAFLFFLGFASATSSFQNPVDLKAPLLVGFFLAGLVVHGGLQGWWIAPILGSLGERPLFLGALSLTAFNDNALITYLATLVPGLGENLRLAVVAGAVAGGGLTVIANAPNPAGQAILAPHFEDGISPIGLLAGALAATVVASLALLLL
ncbi:MAG TPA: putative Na+/H+ antiporter [Vicinamibacteria bacterium]|nr:putative Na+/H+ antiporter [Vicinamibacteria bacterium]